MPAIGAAAGHVRDPERRLATLSHGAGNPTPSAGGGSDLAVERTLRPGREATRLSAQRARGLGRRSRLPAHRALVARGFESGAVDRKWPVAPGGRGAALWFGGA